MTFDAEKKKVVDDLRKERLRLCKLLEKNLEMELLENPDYRLLLQNKAMLESLQAQFPATYTTHDTINYSKDGKSNG